MSVTRVPSLIESGIKTANAGLAPQFRSIIGAAGSADVSAALVPLNANVASISGVNTAQAALIAAISGSTLSLQLSASAAFIDIANLDLSTTQSIATLFDTSGSSALTASTVMAVPTSASGWVQLSCNGVNIKIPFWIA